MRNMRNLVLRRARIATVFVCVAVLMGAGGCASQTGESPKKTGGGCLSFLQLFS